MSEVYIITIIIIIIIVSIVVRWSYSAVACAPHRDSSHGLELFLRHCWCALLPAGAHWYTLVHTGVHWYTVVHTNGALAHISTLGIQLVCTVLLYPCTTGTTGTLAQYYLHMCARWSLLVKIWHSLLNCSAYSYFPLAFGRFGTLELELGSASE